jgi:hypothetical protein
MSAAHPTRNAGQISPTLSSDQPGSELHATWAYFAGSDGSAGCVDVEEDAGGGVDGAARVADGGCAVLGGFGAVAQPARTRRTASRAAVEQADRVARERSKESEERDKMLWFFLEALVALLIAVAIVGWTMGSGRRKPRDKPGGRDGDRP